MGWIMALDQATVNYLRSMEQRLLNLEAAIQKINREIGNQSHLINNLKDQVDSKFSVDGDDDGIVAVDG